MKKDITIPVKGYYLECTIGSHNKFYVVLIADDGTVVTNWGRIGTHGQFKVDKMPNADKAAEVGMRQYYAKATKGYETKAKDVVFEVEPKLINDSHADSPTALIRAFRDARQAPVFRNEADLALKHYADFAAKAEKLLIEIPRMDFEQAFARSSELGETWTALTDKHDEVAVIVKMTRQMLSQKLGL